MTSGDRENPPSAPKLCLRNLVKIYGSRRVVDDVGLDVTGGQVVGLLGPNGAGKTTTFYMAVGMVRPDGGRVLLDGRDVTKLQTHLRARKGIGYLPQEASTFRKLTVYENVAAVLQARGHGAETVAERTGKVLSELGIERLADRRADGLSGGERRRLEIARALSLSPAFILLDEPFAGIDPLAVIDIKQIIGQLKEKGIGVLISDHNVRETLGACDTAYILNQGKVIESGPPEMIAESPTARRIYLGDEFRL